MFMFPRWASTAASGQPTVEQWQAATGARQVHRLAVVVKDLLAEPPLDGGAGTAVSVSGVTGVDIAGRQQRQADTGGQPRGPRALRKADGDTDRKDDETDPMRRRHAQSASVNVT